MSKEIEVVLCFASLDSGEKQGICTTIREGTELTVLVNTALQFNIDLANIELKYVSHTAKLGLTFKPQNDQEQETSRTFTQLENQGL